MELKAVSHMLGNESLSSCITTFSSLDDLLGGGVSTGTVTQIAGEAGIGKTQLCFQLCLDVQIPKYLGGLEGQAVYLDTENTFQPMRLLEMAEALIQHYQKLKPDKSKEWVDMCATRYLSGIYMFRCFDIVQLLAASHQMFEFIKQHPKVKLIVVDSVAHCIRHEEDSKARIKFLNTLAENFRKLALCHNIAVVVVNQVTTSFSSSNHACIIPALGRSWSYVPSTKIMLIKRNQERFALLYKSPNQPRGVFRFCVNKNGFRDFSEGNKESTVSLPPYMLTQTTANELLSNDFESSQEDVESCPKQINVPEDISEKWLLLSQNQLNSAHHDLDDYNDVLEENTHEIVTATDLEPKIAPLLDHSKAMKLESPMKFESKAEIKTDRSPSPVLVYRLAKKRKLRR